MSFKTQQKHYGRGKTRSAKQVARSTEQKGRSEKKKDLVFDRVNGEYGKVGKRFAADFVKKVRRNYDASHFGSQKLEYKSHYEAMSACEKALAERAESVDKKPSAMDADDYVRVLLDCLPLCRLPDPDADTGSTESVFYYNYDRHIYERLSDNALKKMVHWMGCGGDPRDTMFRAVRNQLFCLLDKHELDGLLLPYEPLPRWYLPVRNGLFNLITKKLEDFTPMWFTRKHCDIPYIPEAIDYTYFDSRNQPYDFERYLDELANHNPRRKRLLFQICQAVVYGKYEKTPMFALVGDGYNGKSMFVDELLVPLAGGERFTARIGLTGKVTGDMYSRIDGARLIAGTDNGSCCYIQDDARFKILTDHGYFDADRKYEKALRVRSEAVNVQCFNAMPRFRVADPATGRRITCVRFETNFGPGHKHYNPKVEGIVTNKAYPEHHNGDEDAHFIVHAFAWILTMPFYEHFEDVDQDLFSDTLVENNSTVQFVQDLVDKGVFEASVSALPVNHLYAAYCDYMEQSHKGETVLSSRTFVERMSQPLKDLGFELSKDGRVRVSTLVRDNRYNCDLLGDSESVAELVGDLAKQDNKTRFFERTAAIDADKVQLSPLRLAKQAVCTMYHYFGIENVITAYLDDEQSAKMRELDTELFGTDEGAPADEKKQSHMDKVMGAIRGCDFERSRDLVCEDDFAESVVEEGDCVNWLVGRVRVNMLMRYGGFTEDESLAVESIVSATDNDTCVEAVKQLFIVLAEDTREPFPLREVA